MITVIFGAGASHGCIDEETSRKASWVHQPPISQSLFSEDYLGRQQMYKIKDLAHSLNTHAYHENSIEEVLDEIYLQKGRVKEMIGVRFYLEDLFSEISRNFLNNRASHFTSLIRHLEDFAKEIPVTFATFNYDTLLEQAMASVIPSYKFVQMDDYLSPNGRYKLVKLHGSCNWRYSLSEPLKIRAQFFKKNNKEKRFEFALNDIDFNKLSNENIFVCNDHDLDSDYSPPAISLPITSKDTSSFVCPKSMLDHLGSALEKTSYLIVIGWKGQEKHFNRTYLKLLPPNALITIVTKKSSTYNDIVNRMRKFVNPSCHFNKVQDGFSKYVTREKFKESIGLTTAIAS